jgi:enoyl-CoA hydratase/carnithine racemase
MSNLVVTDTATVRWITFNREAKLNAWLWEDIVAVTALVREAAQTKRAIAFRGAGTRAFSAGVDVGTFLALTPESARRFITDLRDFLGAVRTAPIPTLCLIDGYCLGGALELALAADIRLVTPRATFGMPEIKVGIPSVLDAALLTQHVGLGKAKEMLLTGDLYDVLALERYGLFNEVVASPALDATATRLLDRLTGHSPAAVRAQKALFETWQNEPLQVSIAASVESFAAIFAAPETAEHLAAYAARFQPRKGGA